MGYTLGQAARTAGRSKTTLNRAIKTGKLSVVRSEDGSYTIDPAELQRVYPRPLTAASNGHTVRSLTAGTAAVTQNGADPEPAPLQQLLAERERLAEEQPRRFAICAPGWRGTPLGPGTADRAADRSAFAAARDHGVGRFLAWRRPR